jgi:hypothetical protein
VDPQVLWIVATDAAIEDGDEDKGGVILENDKEGKIAGKRLWSRLESVYGQNNGRVVHYC